jgi:hypothetical protein
MLSPFVTLSFVNNNFLSFINNNFFSDDHLHDSFTT